MKRKKIIASILAVVLSLLPLSVVSGAINIDMVETQYVYDESDYSWLRDLTVKEDMLSVSGLSRRNTLIPKTSYPYTENAETFKKKLEMYQLMYTLDDDMSEVAMIYVQNLAEQYVGKILGNGASDDYVKSYLTSAGIVFPEDSDSGSTKIMARIVYAFLVSDPSIKVARGTALNDVFNAYGGKILGINSNVLLSFVKGGSIKDFRQYAMAACRYGLYKAGYNVNADTPEKEVSRLMAVYIIKNLGITIDPNTATDGEIRSKFLCVMLNSVYDVSAEPSDMEAAVLSNTLPTYMVRVIAKENGVTIDSNKSYEEAFNICLTKTDAFKIPDGEFYADIYEYDVHLQYKRSSIWVNPSTYVVSDESNNQTVEVRIDGKPAKNKYYNEVSVDKKKARDTITIVVDYVGDSGTKQSTYVLNVFQGTAEPPVDNTISNALDSMQDKVVNVIDSLGNTSVGNALSGIVKTIPFKLPERVLSISSLLLPSIIGAGDSMLSKFFGYFSTDNKTNNSNVNSGTIHGVGGLDAYNSNPNTGLSVNFSTGAQGSLTIQTPAPVTNPANGIVDTPVQQEMKVEQQSETIFTKILNDPKILAVVIVCLVVIFVVCVVVFNEIIKLKGQNGEFAGAADKQEGNFIAVKQSNKKKSKKPLVVGEASIKQKKPPKKRKNVDAISYTGPTTVTNTQKDKHKRKDR